MIWLVDTMRVDGELTVSGGDGEHVNTLSTAWIPARGGRGGPAGGDGGDGSPQVAMRSFAGMSGNGPGNLAGRGGTGGLPDDSATGRGSGGGGGAFATHGDPHYPRLALPGTSFVQQLGLGGFGGPGVSGSATRSLRGGGPGGNPFADGVLDNDFVGVAYDVFRNRFVVGELPILVGGSGGGGGGDLALSPDAFGTGWRNDSRGGGGGGGGGCLVVAATGFVHVSATGSITSNGGHGGGGEQAGSSSHGGGGGGGSGGLIVLAAPQLVLEVHGETYARRDYDFVLSADGGACTTGPFSNPVVTAKYPLNGQQPLPGTSYDSAPLGGFGGMGIVQLVTPVGTNADGTNTVLDDNIEVRRGGVVLIGTEKVRFLAWRGFDAGQGVLVDDSGNPPDVGANEGDIRPSPILMPLR